MKIRFKSLALLISVFWLTALPSTVFSNSLDERDSIRTESLHVHLNTNFFVAGESLLFKIYCVDAKGRPSTFSSTAYVELIGKDKKPLTQIKVRLVNGVGTGDHFFAGDVPTGNYTLVAYTKWMRNFDQENFFRQTITVVNPAVRAEDLVIETPGHTSQANPTSSGGNGHLSLVMDGIEFGQRQKISLRITSDSTSSWSLSVNARVLDPGENRGSPSFKQQNVDPIATDPVRFLPDLRGELLTGVITEKATGKPLAKKLVSLSAPSRNFEYLMSTTDSAGRYYFIVKNMDADVALLKVINHSAKDLVIKPEQNFLDDHSRFAPPALKLDSTLKKMIEQRYLRAQVENAFYKVKKDSVVQEQGRLRFFGVPDKIYRLDDFMRFQTMEDIFREIIPEVVLKVKDEKFAISIANLVSGERFYSQPLILLDGVPMADVSVVMNLDPLKVKTISIVARHYYYGGLETDGIISIETFTGDADNIVVDDMVKLSYIAPTPQKFYNSPNYSNSAELSRIPDYRTQLYWNPTVTMEMSETKAISFYTSDVVGQHFIEVVGTSSSGEIVYWAKTFFIK